MNKLNKEQQNVIKSTKTRTYKTSLTFNLN